MLHNLQFAGNFDLVSLIFSVFVGFFIALILYLRREDRREGYPLEDDVTGRLERVGSFFFFPEPKEFRLPSGEVISRPDGARDVPSKTMRQTTRSAGSPFQPIGDPMKAGVGPGSYAQRSKKPDVLSHSGAPKIVPLRVAKSFWIDKPNEDPRGAKVYGADGAVAGIVTDLWVDQAEFIIRYLQVETSGGGTVLLPLTMAVVVKSSDAKKRKVKVNAITASQFAGVPKLASADQVTIDEEERIVAYYGAGHLYATPDRLEPLI